MSEITRGHGRGSNHLLAALSPPDLARLRPHLKPMNLKLRYEMERPNKPIEAIYFMHTGIASVVAEQANSTRIEIGLIGREGMSGSSVLLGDDQSPHSTYIQAIGTGERIATKELQKATTESATLRRLLLKYVQSFMVQTAHTAIANARAKVPERLARWLLMAQDRVGGDTLALTHEFLGLMLGVRRAGVTEAVGDLQRRKVIKAQRGVIIVLNRKGLERIAGGFYGLPEQEYRRLLG
jgi:CRP-like cAMP-binding protein